ncbi:MAG: precorrin-2 dehydrogenase/sirohydrochlorin ferrochelatase family protein [Actinomycetota bacterium]
MTTGYPAILLLEGRLAVVIGGGQVAERKVRTLRDAGAKVRLVSDQLTRRLRELAEAGDVELVERRYERGDLAGAAVAVAATDDEEVNRGVFAEATDAGIPVNVVDNIALCTFIAPSIVRRGDLVVAISTGGAAPALAVRIRERLEREFGDEYARFLELMAELRDRITVPGNQDDRAKAWYRVIDSDVMDLVRAGEADRARERATALLLGKG